MESPITSLTPAACRVLGSLLEKERTVPATYPLTAAALLTACNQTTGREPVLALDEGELDAAVDELRAAGAVRLVHPSHGARTIKFRQVADELLGLDGPGGAALTLLLLRGPQTAGELRTRSDRLHPFESVDEVESALARLAGHDPPLVARLERRPGQKEQRWIHRLAPTGASPDPAPGRAPVPVPRSAPVELVPALQALAGFVGRWQGGGHGTYPTISPFAYTEEIELRPVPGKPLLAYRSATRAVDDGRTLHVESGFVRMVADDGIELVVAHGAGLVEIAEGVVDGNEILLASTMVRGTTTAKAVTATERRYRVDGDALTYEVAMAAVGQPLQPHLEAELRRS